MFQGLKLYGKVVDEPSFCCFIENLQRPKWLVIHLLGFSPRLYVVHEHEIRVLFETQGNHGPISVASHPSLSECRNVFDVSWLSDLEPSRRIRGPLSDGLRGAGVVHLL